jgi:hypothetical protein
LSTGYGKNLTVCKEPGEPTYRAINPAVTAYKHLKGLEREELRDLKATHKRKYREYREKKSALRSLPVVKRIQDSVDRKSHHLLENRDISYDISPKKRLSPTQKVRERDLATAYQKSQKAPKDSDLNNWLAEWQVTYTQCKDLNLPEVHANRTSIDVFGALRPLTFISQNNSLTRPRILRKKVKIALMS